MLKSLSPANLIRTRPNLPVLTQELRVRQRGMKPFVIMFVYAAVLSAVALLVLHMLQPRVSAMSHLQQVGVQSSGADLAWLGRSLFTSLSIAQLAMIALIVPAYSSGAVTTERERGTLDLLVLTLLSSSGIVVQKLAAALAQAVMLTVASVPVVSIVFMLGGVSPMEVAVVYALLLLAAGMFGALGLFCSCQFRNTKTATFVSYLVVLGFLVGLPVMGEYLRSIIRYRSDEGFMWTFTLLFAFMSAAMALFPYAIAALILRKRTDHWRSRSFRMAVFGGVYGLTMLVLNSPHTADPLISTLFTFNGSLFLPMFVNPFMAMVMFMNQSYSPGGPWAHMAYWAVGCTLAFSAACIYLFKHLSTFRFEAMRRSQ